MISPPTLVFFGRRQARYVAGQGGIIWGGLGDMPALGDYDGDGRMDISIFRPSTGAWYIKNSSTRVRHSHGAAPGMFAAPGDYDGDGKTDIAVFRPSSGNGTFGNRRRKRLSPRCGAV